MNNDTAFAAGDSRLMIFSGSQKPVTIGEYLYDDEIQSVFYSEKYVGLVFYRTRRRPNTAWMYIILRR